MALVNSDFLGYWGVVWMSVELFRIPFGLKNVITSHQKTELGPYRCDLHLCNFRHVVRIVDTISQDVTEIPKGTLQSIGRPLLLCFLKGRSFAFTILDVTVSEILGNVSKDIPDADQDPHLMVGAIA